MLRVQRCLALLSAITHYKQMLVSRLATGGKSPIGKKKGVSLIRICHKVQLTSAIDIAGVGSLRFNHRKEVNQCKHTV